MPVERYRDLADARRALWADVDAPDRALRMRRLWAFWSRLASKRVPRGVRRFRTLEDALRDRATWVSGRPGSD